jgi:hypothetical protein
VHTSQHDAGSFLEKIPVDLVAAQQRDTTIPVGPFGPHDLEFVGQILRLRLESDDVYKGINSTSCNPQ